MARRRTEVLLAGGLSWLSGCAAVDPGPQYDRAAQEIRSATGVAEVFHPGATPELANRRSEELLSDGLTLEEAVEHGLLHNPSLQAGFHTIGIAHAERVQAGLLSNPSLGALLHFPLSGGPTEIDAGLFTNLAELWQLSDRERVSESDLKHRVLTVAHEAAQLAAQIRIAFAEAVAAQRLARIAAENRATAQQLFELAESRLEAAATTVIDVNLARLEWLETELALQDAELAAGETRRSLATLMGLASRDPKLQRLVDDVQSDPSLPSVDALEALALDRRLDVRAAEESVRRADLEVERQRSLVFRSVEVGVAAEKQADWSIGPGVDIELPIFDQNQAQIAKARQVRSRNNLQLTATRLDALREVDSALARVDNSRAVLKVFREDLLTRSTETLDQTRESYQLGKTTILEALAAQRRLLEVRTAYIERLFEADCALSDLERATGTPRQDLFVR